VEADNIGKLQEAVQQLVLQGFQPLGGIAMTACMTPHGVGFTCAQAMVK
jgi:hypothetical protein